MSRFDVSRLLPNTLVVVLVMPGPHTSQIDGPCTRIGLFIGRCRGMAIVMLNRGQRQIRVRECWVMPDPEVARAKVERWIAGQERDAENRARSAESRTENATLRAKITELSREAEDLRMSAEEWRDKYVAARREIERLTEERDAAIRSLTFVMDEHDQKVARLTAEVERLTGCKS